MNAEDFEKVFDFLVEQSRKVLVEKAAQYADDRDRMHNFKVAGAFKGETPEQALWGFLVKHLVSVQDMVQSGEFYPDEMWDEKIGDSINYLILLRALVLEEDEEDPRINPPRQIVNQTIINNHGNPVEAAAAQLPPITTTETK